MKRQSPQFALLAVTLVLSMIGLLVLSCSDGHNPTESDRGPHVRIEYPEPGPASVPLVTELSWSLPTGVSTQGTCSVFVSDNRFLRGAQVYVPEDTRCVVGPLEPDTEYFWKVRVEIDAGTVIESEVSTFVTGGSQLSPNLVFPLAISCTWDFERRFWSSSDISSDYSIPDVFYDTIAGFGSSEVYRLDTLANSVETFVVRTSWEEDDGLSGGVSEAWIGNVLDGRRESDNGLFTYAYRNAFIGLVPKTTPVPSYYIEFKGLRFANQHEVSAWLRDQTGSLSGLAAGAATRDDIHYEDPPIRELAYPIEAGKRWTYRSAELGHIWDMEKEVMAIEPVSVPAGDFECYKIRWYWDIDGDGEWDEDIRGYDYITSIGNVRRRFEGNNWLMIYADGAGNVDTLGVYDWVDEYYLTEFHVAGGNEGQ